MMTKEKIIKKEHSDIIAEYRAKDGDNYILIEGNRTYSKEIKGLFKKTYGWITPIKNRKKKC